MHRDNRLLSLLLLPIRVSRFGMREIFPRAFPNWFLGLLFGTVFTLFGALCTVVNVLVPKPGWIAGLLGLASLALGLALLRHAIRLRARVRSGGVRRV